MNKTVKEGKNIAIVAYLTFVGTLIAWSMNADKHNKFAAFHLRQAVGLNLLWILFAVLISGFDQWFVSLPFYLICILLWCFGFIGAIQGKLSFIPFLGYYFQKWFKKIA